MTTTVVLLLLTAALLFAYLVRRRARLNWLRGTATPGSFLLNLGLKSTAVAMGSVSVGAALFGTISTRAHLILLSLGLLALALSTLQDQDGE